VFDERDPRSHTSIPVHAFVVSSVDVTFPRLAAAIIGLRFRQTDALLWICSTPVDDILRDTRA
jgi:hypothetical protein